MRSSDDQILFFDLAGTLVDIDAHLPDHHAAALRRVGQRARRVILVTGQPSDDPQVRQVVAALRDLDDFAFVAYTTRGGRRYVLKNHDLVEDSDYLLRHSLDTDLQLLIESVVSESLDSLELLPLIPVECIDHVAIRVNLDPSQRERFIEHLLKQLQLHDLQSLQAVSEGRTSVFIMREGVGKRLAVENELELLRGSHSSDAYYFGNEFQPGVNDWELLGISGLETLALGPVGPLADGHECRSIGEGPEDLYTLLEPAVRPGKEPYDVDLPVVCLSLGGTKIQVGALTAGGDFASTPMIRWRETERYARTIDRESHYFCDELAKEILAFLDKRGYDVSDVGSLGVPFPGPCDGGKWYSNNLPSVFRKGVALEEELRTALQRQLGSSPQFAVRVQLDAQCDAGGELYHPDGRLTREVIPDSSIDATVLNVATGIAAGFIKSGRVLSSDEEFRQHLGPSYDAGAGQLGRHLWYSPSDGRWQYKFAPRGGLPAVADAVRMTERLSGPALAARLLLALGRKGLFPDDATWTSEVSREEVEKCYATLLEMDATGQSGKGARFIRSSSSPIAKAILTWADQVYFDNRPNELHRCVAGFAQEVASDLGAAFSCWMGVKAWRVFSQNIVLTGGVGIRFLASSDSLPERSFLSLLRPSLPSECNVMRSRLTDAIERESYMFLPQAMSLHEGEGHHVDESRAEFRYAGIIDRLKGQWRFESSATVSQPAKVDVASTNEKLVLGGRKLDDFDAIAPDTNSVPTLAAAPDIDALSARKLGVVLLCGGLGTRSGGQIHPLMPVSLPGSPQQRTLLQIRLEQFERSPLIDSELFIMGSLLNEAPLREHLGQLKPIPKARLFCGGLVPRLDVVQSPHDSAQVYRDEERRPVYNPGGHFDALRWLVVSGMLSHVLNHEVVMVASYSNIGHVFTNDSLRIAAQLQAQNEPHPKCFMMTEVVARPQSKRTGSMLVRCRHSKRLHLVKYGYGHGHPRLATGNQKLMSTNTVYFSIPGVTTRLLAAAQTADIQFDMNALRRLLQADNRDTSRLARLFDAAFPVMPQLSVKDVGADPTLQAERDLDQISLLDSCTLNVIQVPPDRAVSLKLPSDLNDTEKRRFLVASDSSD